MLCTPGSTSGFATAIVNNNTLANGGYWIGQQTVTITAASSGVSLLTDTGITANQCYGAGSDALISCLSPAAIALNDKQDGMLGRDVTNSDSTDGWLGASYSISTSTVTVVSGTTTTITTTTDPNCLKDNVTGLTWQRASTTLTALRGNTQNDEAMGYRTTANTTGLCGFYDWRLPTPGELHSLLNYGSSSALYAIDMNWFPLTRSAWYITGTPYLSGNSANVWVDDFVKGRVDGISASGGSVELRLVR